MERIDIIDAVGREYHTANIENGEFSYPKAFKEKNLDFEPIHKKKGNGSWQFLDIRFELDGVSLLIETKNDADKWPTVEEQIAAYVEYEKRLTGNKIIAMVANTTDDRITVWKSEVEDDRKLDTEEAIRTMPEYVSMFDAKHTNNKEEVMRNTYQLNELLHRHGVGEKLRSQFVGTCLLAIKNGLVYDRKMKTAQIIGGIRTILEDLLEGSLKKAEKLTLIDKRVLKNQESVTWIARAFVRFLISSRTRFSRLSTIKARQVKTCSICSLSRSISTLASLTKIRRLRRTTSLISWQRFATLTRTRSFLIWHAVAVLSLFAP